MKLLLTIMFLTAGLTFGQAPPPPKPSSPPAAPAPAKTEDKQLTDKQDNMRLKAEAAYAKAYYDLKAAIQASPQQKALDDATEKLNQVKTEIEKECGGTLQSRPDPANPTAQVPVCAVPVTSAKPK